MIREMKISGMLLCLALCAACSSDSDDMAQEPVVPQQSYPLTIEVTENPLIVDGEEGSGSNKAAITTTSTLESFNLNYWYGVSATGAISPAPSKDTEGKWTTTGSWPSEDPSVTVNWYASTNGTFNLNGGNPYINFTVEELASNQKDLLVATASGTYSGTGGKLSFTFDHACSALRFYVKKATNLDGYTLTVTNIVLKHVVKQGSYYYGTGEWTRDEVRTDYTLFSGSKALTSTTEYQLLNGTESNAYLFVIPQTLTGGTGATETYIEVAWESNYGGTSSGTAKIPLTKTLEKGNQYNVKINIGTTTLTTL